MTHPPHAQQELTAVAADWQDVACEVPFFAVFSNPVSSSRAQLALRQIFAPVPIQAQALAIKQKASEVVQMMADHRVQLFSAGEIKSTADTAGNAAYRALFENGIALNKDIGRTVDCLPVELKIRSSSTAPKQ